MSEHAALQECSQLLFDEARHSRAIVGLSGVVQEGREMVLQRAVQNAVLGVTWLILRARPSTLGTPAPPLHTGFWVDR